MTELDAVRLNFSPESLVALNFVLAFVMFGVALDMKAADFRGVTAAPRAVLIGMTAQFLLLPAAAWTLTMLLRPQPSIALGILLVACCPGGNI
jgi:bile acid:Na+ symporter, BASS family